MFEAGTLWKSENYHYLILSKVKDNEANVNSSPPMIYLPPYEQVGTHSVDIQMLCLGGP